MGSSDLEPPRARRSGRSLVLWLAALLLAVPPALADDEATPGPVVLSTKVLRLDPDHPERLRIGRLTWRGGIEITSPDRRLGGLSGLLVSADGTRLLAVSDEGSWLTAALRYDAEGRLIGLADAQMAALRDRDGDAITTKRWGDTESLARLGEDAVLVGFERRHRIWRYDLDDGRPLGPARAWPTPEGLAAAPSNSGLEALTELSGDGLLALTEGQDTPAGKAGYLWRGGAWSRLTYRPAADFSPSGASLLPGGDGLLVLERAANPLGGFHARLVRLAVGDLRPGAQLRGEELARWGPPLTIDNFEGIAARRDPAGGILVYLLSDDNFSVFERTLLVMFALAD